ncbi:uncharacterized protein DUF2242 [Trinickia symbiotica]|uniref:DUF2242 domain-containing protein n=1 Tax=Trinickia symbiotica TaxID=863227 RepID=A0A2N7X5U5_9BURK|nr:DUF2242 domain-containing protein [Trinickia symbiotica]PMS36941.1 DUF2242 domain-containing protein [Trinickia symbiotica]PPK41389.1 uncharacterized protein DUF2242 [Trinickia symbiotica]
MQKLYRSSLLRVTLPLAAAVALGALAACSSTKPPSPQQEFFETGSSPFSRTFNANSTQTCEAARRALLNQGYLATATRPDTIDATRDFQPNGDKHITVEFHVVCTPGDDPESTSIVYANAVQSGYALKKSDTSASVGFSLLGSVSLPIRSSSDSMVKVSSETIKAGTFYKQFFEYVDHYLHAAPKALRVAPTPIKEAQLPGGPAAAATPPASPAAAPATPAVAAAASQPAVAAPATHSAVTAPPATQPTATAPETKAAPAATAQQATMASASAAAAAVAAPAPLSTPTTPPATAVAAATVTTAAATAPALPTLTAQPVSSTKLSDPAQPAANPAAAPEPASAAAPATTTP